MADTEQPMQAVPNAPAVAADSTTLEYELRDFPVTQVTVFPDRAEIRRAVPLTKPLGLPGSPTTVLLKGLHHAVDEASIRYGRRLAVGWAFVAAFSWSLAHAGPRR